MSELSDIEWTDSTWNPVIGCSRVAKSNGRSGCDHCYAEGQVHRFGKRYDRPTTIKLGASKRPGLTFLPVVNGESLGKGARWTGAVWLLPDVLDVPLLRRKSTTYFVNSLSDVFHESIVGCEEGRRFIAAMFGVMAATPQHTYQLLTKRPEQARKWFEWIASEVFVDPVEFAVGQIEEHAQEALDRVTIDQKTGQCRVLSPPWPLPNVWMMTSVEDQEAADERIDQLLDLPSAIYGLSVEPMLGPVVLPQRFLDHGKRAWTICGGESGPGARPMHPDWARSLREQCVAAGAPYFFKQWGEHGPTCVNSLDGTAVFRSFPDRETWVSKALTWLDKGDVCVDMTGRVLKNGGDFATAVYPVSVSRRLGKGFSGRELDGRTWDEFPGGAR